MSSLKISRWRVIPSGNLHTSGGFGDVEKAELRTSLLGPKTVIALKKFRTQGTHDERVRVVAVGLSDQVLLVAYYELP